MTDVAGGYRSLSQLGAALPPPAADRSSEPSAPPGTQPLFDVPRPSPGPVTFPVHDATWVVPLHPQVAVPIGARDAGTGAVAVPDGTWQLPGMPLPVLLPTPDRVVREGVDLLRVDVQARHLEGR